MTLLHQAAQKAVEAHYKELGDAWIAFDGSPGTAKRVNFALGMLGFVIDALVAQMPALQHQEVPPVHIDVERMNRALRGPRILIPEGLSVEEVVAFINGHADCMAEKDQHQEVPREPVATEPECKWPVRPLKKVQVTMPDGSSALLVPERAYFSAWAVQELENSFNAASPSTTRQQEVGSVPPAKLVNGQWEGVPLSQFPELQEQVRKGLADGSIQIGCGDASVEWTPEDEKRLDDALAKRADTRAAAPSTPEKTGGVPEDTPADEKTGWPTPELMQDDDRKLSKTLAHPLEARLLAKPVSITAGAPASGPHPLPAQANDGGEHG